MIWTKYWTLHDKSLEQSKIYWTLYALCWFKLKILRPKRWIGYIMIYCQKMEQGAWTAISYNVFENIYSIQIFISFTSIRLHQKFSILVPIKNIASMSNPNIIMEDWLPNHIWASASTLAGLIVQVCTSNLSWYAIYDWNFIDRLWCSGFK